MDFAVIDELKNAAEAIYFSKTEERASAAGADERKSAQRREFATLMRSIKSLVRENA
jgi:hypothetical protein